ncbi:hypothetical protein SCHPADRAFT_897975 [Schizopora paradoxa]|uniref:Uncharacterized protein n=1 Tax=Schizopora paradoxa TaxID=27342 RepID=A0A0H2SFU7_9AGAM|nr:hypothetical protein SCHPADRAFT_897975 [Schizopora paradoxa]
MDHVLHDLDSYLGRKMSCSLQYALTLEGTPFSHTVSGGLEFPHYESYDVYFNHFLSKYATLTLSPQYRISKKAKEEKGKDKRGIDGYSKWPDFVMIRSEATKILAADDQVSSWVFKKRIVLAVIEIKPLCAIISPAYSAVRVASELERCLTTGELQAEAQAKFVLSSSPDQTTVFAIHGAGPYWTFTIYDRSQNSPRRKSDEDVDKYAMDRLLLDSPPFCAPLVKLGTKQSEQQLLNMLNLMKVNFGISDDDL